jgi:thioredoxin reductase (NADPH)
MSETPYDLIVVGGGPAGLMCALTAVSGVPINPPRHFSALVLDRFDIGEFCKHGKLRLTHKWAMMGAPLIAMLKAEAETAGLDLRDHEPVVAVELAGELKRVATDKGEFAGRKLAVCTGFFPHSEMAKYAKKVRVVFSPAQLEARFVPRSDEGPVAMLGGGPATCLLARALAELRPDLSLLLGLEEGEPPADAPTVDRLELHRGSLAVVKETGSHLLVRLLGRDGAAMGERKCSFLLVDYNSYTLRTRNTAFLEGQGLTLREGYVVVDGEGRTGVPGVFAAGNITTPVSGVLTALNSGFLAGLAINRELHLERFGGEPLFYPWLPMDGLDSHPLRKS